MGILYPRFRIASTAPQFVLELDGLPAEERPFGNHVERLCVDYISARCVALFGKLMPPLIENGSVGSYICQARHSDEGDDDSGHSPPVLPIRDQIH